MFDDFWKKISGRLPALFKTKATEDAQLPGIPFSVTGHDAYNLKKALKIINSGEKDPLTPTGFMHDAVKLFEHYTKTTEAGGEYFRVFQASKKFPVLNFPIDRQLEVNLRLVVDENGLGRIEKIRQSLGFKTQGAVLTAALNFYVEAFLLNYYGWKIFSRQPDGPDEGEPIFDDAVEEFNRYHNLPKLAANAA